MDIRGQFALESEMASRGAEALRREIARARAENRTAATPRGKYLMRRAISPVADGIRAFPDTPAKGRPGRPHVAAGYLRHLDPEVAAFPTLALCVNSPSSDIT